MTVPIPNHLVGITGNEKRKTNRLKMEVTCQCGSNVFRVLRYCGKYDFDRDTPSISRNAFWKEANAHPDGFKAIDGKLYETSGDSEKKYCLSDCPCDIEDVLVEIECPSCGVKHVLYDNRIHGLGSIVDNYRKTVNELHGFSEREKFKEDLGLVTQIKVDVENAISLQEFNFWSSMTVDKDTYSLGFSHILITGTNDNETEITIYSNN